MIPFCVSEPMDSIDSLDSIGRGWVGLGGMVRGWVGWGWSGRVKSFFVLLQIMVVGWGWTGGGDPANTSGRPKGGY